jgi:hypothetical protein
MGQSASDRNELTARDLLMALGWHIQLIQVDNDLANYWHLRFELLSRALGLPAGWSEDSRTPRMINLLGEQACQHGFFSRFLEYTPLPGEMAIVKRHMIEIEAAETSLRERLLDCAEELLLQFWPDVRGSAVDNDQLVSMGLPVEQPDPIDYM